MRDINKFSIDYIQNYPNASNPTNAAMHLEYGYDAFVSDVVGNTNYWKFPGFVLYRTAAPTHGITVINRGIVLRGPSSQKIGSFVSFNGDSFGSDSPNTWYGELVMYSHVSGLINVQLNSGSTSNGGSSFVLKDQNNAVNFSVDTAGNVTIKGTLGLNSLSLSSLTSATSSLGAASASSMTINPGELNCRTITTNGQPITCGAVNAGSNRIDCGLISVTGNVTCATLTVTSGFTSLSVTGTTTTATLNATAAIQVAGFECCNDSGIWKRGLQADADVIAARFGIFGAAFGIGTKATPVTFTTANGKTVTVIGGIITGITP